MSEVVLIEFIGDAKSGVAAANEQVAANKEVEASAKRASTSAVTASKSATASMAATGASMKKVGHSMTKYISLPLLGIGAASAKMSLDFNRSMLEISTQAGGTRKEVEHLSKAVLDLTAKGRFAQGPQELSEALFHIESVGIRGAKALKTLKASSDLATVGNADLEATTNALVGAMRTGIKGADDIREAIGTMNATIGAGNLRMDELTSAFGTGFLVSAKQVGLTLRDAGAALAELTSQGVPATAAATRLRMSFTLMAAPTEKAKNALKGIGLDSEAMAKQMQRPNGLVNALKLLRGHLQGMTKIQSTQLLSEAFGGARSGTTIMALIGQLGDLGKKYKEVGQNAGDFGKKLKETSEDPAVEWEKSLAELKGALIEIGNELVPVVIPALQDLAGDLAAAGHAFGALPKGTQEWAVKLGVLGIALGPIVRMLGGLTTGLSKVSSVGSKLVGAAAPAAGIGTGEAAGTGVASAGAAALAAQPEILAAAAATAALAAGFYLLYQNSKTFRDQIDELGVSVGHALGEVTAEINPLIHSFTHLSHAFSTLPIIKQIEDLHGPLGSIAHFFRSDFIEALRGPFKEAKHVIEGTGKVFSGMVAVISGLVNTLANVMEGKFGKAWHNIEGVFRSGIKVATGALEIGTAPLRVAAETAGGATVKVFEGVWDTIGSVFKDGINEVIGFINDLIGAINVIPGIPDIGSVGEIGSAPAKSKGGLGKHKSGASFKHHARGGPIHEGAPSGDTVPAMLERGEYVLNRKAVAKVGKGRLDAINFHEAPRFAFGGPVGEAIGSAASSVGKAVTGTLGGALASLPSPHLPPWVQGVGTYLLKQVGDYVKSGFQEQKFGTLTGPSGPSGTQMFDGKPVAKWIIPELMWAMKHGWKGIVTSGWRDPNEVVSGAFATAPQGQSEHQYTRYPGGAVDVSEYEQFARIIAGYPGRRKLIQLGIDPLHFSGTGHQLGGLVQKLAGGGVVGTAGAVLLRNGLDAVSAAGILGNAYGESSWNPAAMEPGTHNGGLWGFTASPVSLSDLEAYANSQGKSWTDVATQTQFMLHHLSGGLKSKLNAAGSTDDTTSLFMREWEHPLNYSSLGVRQGAAKKALGMLGGSGASGVAKTPPKQIKGSYVTHGKGATGPGGGTFAETGHGKYKVQTSALSFSGMPNSIAGCRKELRERRKDLSEYQGAIRHTKDPTTKRALEANAKAIRKRIKELVKEISNLLTKRKREGVTHKIEGRGLFPAIEEAIANRERGYDEASEYAEQVVALEPEENAAGYITNEEGPAWQRVLTEEGNWRNAILGGEQAAAMRLQSLEAQLQAVEALKGAHPKAFQKQKFRIPALKQAIATVKTAWSTNTHGVSGSFEEGLEGLQGPGKSHALLPSLPTEPVAGSFGGLIFDTQMTIRELGLKLKQAGEAGQGEPNSALLDAEKAIAEQAMRGKALAELQYGPLSEFLKHMPPYIGAFAKGGPIPSDGMAMVHKGEYVIPANNVGNSGSTVFNLHLHGDMAGVVDSAMPGMVKQVDKRMGTHYRRITYGPGGRKR